MIDDKMLAELEQRKHEMAVAVGDLAGCDLSEQVEIIRNARRYLALRENCGVFMLSDGSGRNKSSLDTAADRLLEGGE